MFGLRQKLLLGFGGLLVILVIIGTQSIAQLTAQGPLIDVILKEDYQSVLACQKMKESLEQIDSNIESLLLGGGDAVRSAIRARQQDFEAAFDSQSKNINVPGEAEQTVDLRAQYQHFAEQLPRLLDASLTDAQRREQYFNTVRPIVAQCIATADEILRSNQENMGQAAHRAKEKADGTVRRLYILFAAGAFAAVAFFALIQRWIMRPIRNLTASVQEVERDNLDTDVRIESTDEFATLATAFNAMAALAARRSRRRPRAVRPNGEDHSNCARQPARRRRAAATGRHHRDGQQRGREPLRASSRRARAGVPAGLAARRVGRRLQRRGHGEPRL